MFFFPFSTNRLFLIAIGISFCCPVSVTLPDSLPFALSTHKWKEMEARIKKASQMAKCMNEEEDLRALEC